MAVAVAASAAVGLHETETSKGVVGFRWLSADGSGREMVSADSAVAARETAGGLDDLASFQNAARCACEGVGLEGVCDERMGRRKQ